MNTPPTPEPAIMEQEDIPPNSRATQAPIPTTSRITLLCFLTKRNVSFAASFAFFAALWAVAAVFFAVFSALRISLA